MRDSGKSWQGTRKEQFCMVPDDDTPGLPEQNRQFVLTLVCSVGGIVLWYEHDSTCMYNEVECVFARIYYMYRLVCITR